MSHVARGQRFLLQHCTFDHSTYNSFTYRLAPCCILMDDIDLLCPDRSGAHTHTHNLHVQKYILAHSDLKLQCFARTHIHSFSDNSLCSFLLFKNSIYFFDTILSLNPSFLKDYFDVRSIACPVLSSKFRLFSDSIVCFSDNLVLSVFQERQTAIR